MGIFGWSYPPGCDGPPDDEDRPCEVCGKECDSCICPECPRCGEVGNPSCYADHGMVYTADQLDSMEAESMKRLGQLTDDIAGALDHTDPY